MQNSSLPLSTAVSHLPNLSTQPLYSTLVQFPAVCFVGALITDITYWRSTMFIWETFSVWLLTAGCIMAALTGVIALVTWVARPAVRRAPRAGAYVMVSLVALVLAIINTFIHSRDGYTAVVPTGLTLSIIVVALMMLATWLGWPRRQGAVVTHVSPSVVSR